MNNSNIQLSQQKIPLSLKRNFKKFNPRRKLFLEAIKKYQQNINDNIDKRQKLQTDYKQIQAKIQSQKLLKKQKQKIKKRQQRAKKRQSRLLIKDNVRRSNRIYSKQHKSLTNTAQQLSLQIKYRQSQEIYHNEIILKQNNNIDKQQRMQIIQEPIIDQNNFNLQQLTYYQQSLLKIQQKIDKHILYSYQFRNFRNVRLDKLIDYLTESQEFFFNEKIFDQLISINPDLYIIVNGITKGDTLIRGNNLSDQNIQQRYQNTFKKMIRIGRIDKNYF